MTTITLDHPVLNRAENGLHLAQRVADALHSNERVVVDFAPVSRATPSFANAFVMTLLARFDLDVLRQRVEMRNRNANVAAAITRSVQRFQSGIRLSTQAPAPK